MNITAGSLSVFLLIYSGTFKICRHKQPWFTYSETGSVACLYENFIDNMVLKYCQWTVPP